MYKKGSKSKRKYFHTHVFFFSTSAEHLDSAIKFVKDSLTTSERCYEKIDRTKGHACHILPPPRKKTDVIA